MPKKILDRYAKQPAQIGTEGFQPGSGYFGFKKNPQDTTKLFSAPQSATKTATALLRGLLAPTSAINAMTK